MLTLKEAQNRIRQLCADAGGVTAWGRPHGLARNNLANVTRGAIKPSPATLKAAGMRRVMLETYLCDGETLPPLPPGLEVVAHKPIPGRPKRIK